MSREKRVSRKISRRRCRRPVRHTLAKQSAAVLAVGLGLAAASPAQARIVHQWVNQTIADGSLFFLDYQGTGNHFQLWHGVWDYGNLLFAEISGRNFGYVQTDQSKYYSLTYLAKGNFIPPGDPYWQHMGYLGLIALGTPYFNSFLGKTGYVGLEFDPGDGNHYAWAQVFMPADASSVTLIDYAYETEADRPIKAGATSSPVPVPNLLLLLGTGAVGLLAYRRQGRG